MLPLFSVIALFGAILSYSQNITTTTDGTTTTYASTEFMTTPALTVSEQIVAILESAAGNALHISQYYCDWNVTQIIKAINKTDPGALYSDTYRSLLPIYLPLYVTRQLPAALLEFYGINTTGPAPDDCTGAAPSATIPLQLPSIDFCVGPLIHTDLLNPVNADAAFKTINISLSTDFTISINYSMAGCGLACSASEHIYGTTPQDQALIDNFKIVGCSLSLAVIFYLAVHLFLERRSKQTQKQVNGGQSSLLSQIPYVITFAGFVLVAMMTLSEVIGKEAIACSEHAYQQDLYPDEERLEMSFHNPGIGRNIACTIQGVIFSAALYVYLFYTVLLCFVILRSLHAPFRPLWGIRHRFWHALVFLLVFALCTAACLDNAYAGIYPMGVCFYGPNGKEQLLWFFNVPASMALALSLCFVCAASVLLRKEMKVVQAEMAGDRGTQAMKDLLYRLIVYAIGVVAAMTILVYTGFKWYAAADFRQAASKKSLECEIAEVFLEESAVDCGQVLAEGRLSPFLFISWVVAVMVGAISQVVLTCHRKSRIKTRRLIMKKFREWSHHGNDEATAVEMTSRLGSSTLTRSTSIVDAGSSSNSPHGP